MEKAIVKGNVTNQEYIRRPIVHETEKAHEENNMIRIIKTKRSTNEVLSDKMVTKNWWGVYHSSAIMEGRRPRYYDGNKMEIIYHEKDYTLTFIK